MSGETYISQRLRAVSLAAFAKIHKNRHKNVPGKWHPDGIGSMGERKWLDVPLKWLFIKTMEEVCELYIAAQERVNENRSPEEDPYLEAGDVTAMAMMIADAAESLPDYSEVPKVVCLCGSTRFKEEFETANFNETMQGNIILSVGAFMHADSIPITDSQKEKLDKLHKQKIDLADEILVLNVGGYIGSSTKSEIEYALQTGKTVRYLEAT
jgi:hypothetical protein